MLSGPIMIVLLPEAKTGDPSSKETSGLLQARASSFFRGLLKRPLASVEQEARTSGHPLSG
jgi:hypothetical protein